MYQQVSKGLVGLSRSWQVLVGVGGSCLDLGYIGSFWSVLTVLGKSQWVLGGLSNRGSWQILAGVCSSRQVTVGHGQSQQVEEGLGRLQWVLGGPNRFFQVLESICWYWYCTSQWLFSGSWQVLAAFGRSWFSSEGFSGLGMLG